MPSDWKRHKGLTQDKDPVTGTRSPVDAAFEVFPVEDFETIDDEGRRIVVKRPKLDAKGHQVVEKRHYAKGFWDELAALMDRHGVRYVEAARVPQEAT